MKLFGMIEAVNIQSMFVVKPVQVPHNHLFRHLEKYSGTPSAGLDLVGDRNEIEICDGLSIRLNKVTIDLRKFFRERKCEVHALGAKSDYDEAKEHIKALRNLEKMIKNSDSDQLKHLQRQKFKLHVILSYLTSVGLESPMIERIAKYKPDLVFVGDSYANSMYRKKDELESRYGIKIEEYWRDVITKDIDSDALMFAAKACDENLTMERILEEDIAVGLKKVESPGELDDDLQRVQLERFYSAITKGRVTDQKPDYIGSWDLDFEEQGLFEVFVKQRKEENGAAGISGIIEDCNGSADFEGRLDKNSISFVKKYTKAAPCAAKGEINYTGLLQPDGRYLGTFCAISCSMGNFWMKPFKEATQSQSP